MSIHTDLALLEDEAVVELAERRAPVEDVGPPVLRRLEPAEQRERAMREFMDEAERIRRDLAKLEARINRALKHVLRAARR